MYVQVGSGTEYEILDYVTTPGFTVIQVSNVKATVNRKLVSAPQRLHLGIRAGGYFIIISHYSMASLNLVRFPILIKIQILWLLLEMILNISPPGYNQCKLLCS